MLNDRELIALNMLPCIVALAMLALHHVWGII